MWWQCYFRCQFCHDIIIIMEICKVPTLRLKALNKHWKMKEGKNTIITLGLDTERGAKTQQSHWAWILKEGQKHNSHVGLGHWKRAKNTTVMLGLDTERGQQQKIFQLSPTVPAWHIHAALRPQGLVGTASPGQPPWLSHSSWALTTHSRMMGVLYTEVKGVDKYKRWGQLLAEWITNHTHQTTACIQCITIHKNQITTSMYHHSND